MRIWLSILGVLGMCWAVYGSWFYGPGETAGGVDIAFVQAKAGQGDGDTVSVSFDSQPAVGNAIVVGFATYYEDVVQGDVTDNQGNTYTLVKAENDSGIDSIGIFVATNIASSGTFTITGDHAAVNDEYPGLAIAEFSGAAAAGPVSASNSVNNGATGTPTAGNVTAESNGAIVGVITHEDETVRAIAAAGGFSEGAEVQATSEMPISLIYRIYTSGGTDAADWTIAGPPTSSAACDLALQP